MEQKERCRKDLESAGARVSSGVKYGSDFLVYLGDPDAVHSSFTVNTDRIVTFKSLSALVRVSATTKKDAVVYIDSSSTPFLKFSRFLL